jgi:hypothetical protein
VFAILYGRALQEVGKLDAYPNRGLFATRECGPGTIFADTYRIPIRSDEARPSLLRVQVGLRDFEAKTELTASVGTLIFAAGKLGPSESSVEPQHPADWRFGDVISLFGHTVELEENAVDRVTLRLFWRSLAAPPEAYTVFVHLLNQQEELVSQSDGQPVDGDYPTDWWSAGEVIVDDHSLSLPPESPEGEYHFAIGLYRLADGTRVPVTDAAGNVQRDGRIVLGPPIRIGP